MKKICIIALTLLLFSGQKLWAISDFSDISGTTITIHNTDEMALLAQKVNSGAETYSDYTFLLGTDLNYEVNTTNNYTAIGTSNTKYFAGTFDGQGHTISGIHISANGRQGLFGSVSGGTIKNLKLTSSTINCTSNSYAGGIIACVDNGVTIENCHVSESVTIKSENSSGGIVGKTDKGDISITGCSSGAKVSTGSSNACVGGIIGQCGNEGNGSYNTNVDIAGCLYYGTFLTGSTEMAGGIVGYYYTTYGSITEQSKVNLSDNFYTYPDVSVKGAGKWKTSNGNYTDETNNFDIIDDKGAIRVRAVTASADIEDMGTEGTQLYIGGITPYTYGIKYADKYYSHVLALEDAADNTDVIAQYAGQIYNVKLRGRTLYKDGNWNTITLPFTLDRTGSIFTDPSQCTVMELDIENEYKIKDDNSDNKYKTGCKDGKLYLFFYGGDQTITTLEAGKPYIVKWEKVNDYNANAPETYDHLYPMFENVEIDNSDPVTITSQDGTVSFVPTYAPFNRDYADRSVLFLGAANMLYYPSGAGNVSVNSFRAYFQLNGVQMVDDSGDEPVGPGNVKVFVLDIEEDDALGIREFENDVNGKSVNGKSDWFDLSGRKIVNGKLPKGIYIHGNRKVIIK